MLGQPVSMLIPEVIGMKLTGTLKEGTTATDLVLTVTQMLRARGVVGKFVEFYGPGLDHLTLADQATIANMAPEYGATCGFFPIDEETIRYLRTSPPAIPTGSPWSRPMPRPRACGATPHARSGLHRQSGARPGAGRAEPGRPQAAPGPGGACPKRGGPNAQPSPRTRSARQSRAAVAGRRTPIYELRHGDVVIAAITSCTNTSNPSVLIAAGLVARKARAEGPEVKPWVKTSLAPGSRW